MNNSEGRELWIRALRSHKYKQVKGRLGDEENGMCCLGLACHLAVEHGIVDHYEPSLSSLESYPEVRNWVGLRNLFASYAIDGLQRSLVEDNDNNKSFTVIADIIESNPANLLKEMQ